MKHLITLLIFFFAFASQTFAVKSAIVQEAETSTSIEYQKQDGFMAKAAQFIAVKTNKIIKKVKDLSKADEALLIILAIVLPPLAVYLYEGEQWTKRCTINLILTILCGIPGIIHALVVILGKK